MFSTASGARASSAESMGRDRVITAGLVVFCQVSHFLTFAAIPLLLPLIREDLEINFTQAGMLSAAGMLSYALAQIPAGYLSDRFGPRRLYFIGLLGWSVLLLIFGLIHAFWLALTILGVAGAFRALLFAPGLALLASWFPPQRRATAMSLFVLGGAGGSILLSLAGPFLAERYGWRATFIVYFGPLFLVPVEVLGSRVAGTTIGFSNLFANIGAFVCVYALGAIRDEAGSFAWGFRGISAACLAGVVLAVVLARMRKGALARPVA